MTLPHGDVVSLRLESSRPGAVRLVFLSDIHYQSDFAQHDSPRRCAEADVLLERAVRRINRFLRPDYVLIGGDLINDHQAPGAGQDLQRVREILDGLEVPWLAIPGNHDFHTERFYKTIPPLPGDHLDVGPLRIAFFPDDPEEPGWNARREADAIRRMEAARHDHRGPLLSLQHVPLFPPGQADCPHNYTNAPEILEAARRAGYLLHLSGHYHAGFEPLSHAAGASLCAPALCEAPYCLQEILVEGDAFRLRSHPLSVDPALGLVDCHVHSPFAYCAEDMDFQRALRMAEILGLAGLGFSEHSDQLYFPRERAWAPGHDFRIEDAAPPQARIEQYFDAALAAGCPPEAVGLEIECDNDGRPVLRPEHAARAGYGLGSIHYLPELDRARPEPETAARQYLRQLERFLPCGFSVLAHPFRVFHHAGVEAPAWLHDAVAERLAAAGVAAEINFHCRNTPPPRFFRRCLERGVPLSFGGDCHNLAQIGDFIPHLAFLQSLGYDAPPGDLLMDPRGRPLEPLAV